MANTYQTENLRIHESLLQTANHNVNQNFLEEFKVFDSSFAFLLGENPTIILKISEKLP